LNHQNSLVIWEWTSVDEGQTGYASYLLRLWQPSHKDRTLWHASLTDPQSGERFGFGSIEALLLFLRQQTQCLTDSPGEQRARDGDGQEVSMDLA
jgi:hypothetical protein